MKFKTTPNEVFMKDSEILENMKFTGKYEFVTKTGIWPEW